MAPHWQGTMAISICHKKRYIFSPRNSIAGLSGSILYATTFGFLAVLAVVKSSGGLRRVLLIGCSALLALGFVARVALAAHWPSDVAISYYLGLLWAAFLIRFAPLGSEEALLRA